MTRTGPFSAIGDPARPARFVVEQTGDRSFELPDGAGFQYNQFEGMAPVVVDRDTLPSTDFASIPSFMSWFVSSYGRHTPAALVHDTLVTTHMPATARAAADRTFLQMLDALDVPPVRGRVMWSAVSIATRWYARGLARLGVITWGVCAAAGMALLARGIATANGWAILAALLAPFPAALLWGRVFWAGVIGGLAMPVIVLPAAASWLGYAAYWLIEQAFRLGRALVPRNRLGRLPQPVGYRER